MVMARSLLFGGDGPADLVVRGSRDGRDGSSTSCTNRPTHSTTCPLVDGTTRYRRHPGCTGV